MKKVILSLTVIISITNGIAQTTKKVCFLGNSYTYVNDMPSIIESIATAGGNTLVKDQNTPGGYKLSQHSTNATSIEKVAGNSWDYVVLQDQSQNPSFPDSQIESQVYPFAKILSDTTRFFNECATPLFFCTWGREVGDPQWEPISTFEGMNNRLFTAYDHMADVNDGKLSPVGIGFRHVFDEASAIVTHADLYSNDGSHPSIHGSYLAACVFYNVIFETTPVGNTFLPSGVSQNEATYLQNVAYHVVNEVDSVTIDYTNLEPVADFTYANSSLDVEFTSTSQNATTYLWNFGDGETSDDQNPIHTYAITGIYTVVLTITNCGLEHQITSEIVVGGLGLKNNFNSKFRVFPNPSNGIVTISTTDLDNEVIIFNLQGQVHTKFIPNSSKISVDLPRGLFLIKQGASVQKIKID